MIHHIWTVLCSQSITNAETHNVSLIEVLEQLTISGSPPSEEEGGLVAGSFEIITLWARAQDDQPSRGRARILMRLPSGSETQGLEYEVDVVSHQRARVKSIIPGLPLRESGEYQFHVQLWDNEQAEWADVANIPLQIVFTSLDSNDSNSG